MTAPANDDYQAPRIERHSPQLIAGLAQDYSYADADRIPAQWQRFSSYIGKVPGQLEQAAYGVMLEPSDPAADLRYLTGVAVADTTGLPADFIHVRITGPRFAVFEHDGHVSNIRDTWDAVWSRWLPRSGYAVTEAPILFERYGEAFDPTTGRGRIELWLPIEQEA